MLANYLPMPNSFVGNSTPPMCCHGFCLNKRGFWRNKGILLQPYCATAMRLAAAEQASAHHGRTWHILAHNNLAYHLLLIGQYDEAQRHVRSGLRMAQRAGIQMVQSYLLSTAGEIALAQGDVNGAERMFYEGLSIAERYGMPERIAGLHANLGLVALAQEDEHRAQTALTQALHEADAAGVHHLATQIRIWLAPLLKKAEATELLNQAEILATMGQRTKLLNEIAQVRQQL